MSSQNKESQQINPKPDLWDMNMPLLNLSENDTWTLRDATSGVQIFGATGSGKSSTSGKAIAKAYLSAGFGGLVLCAKVDEAQRWLQYAKECGREKSIIHVHENGDFRFDFLNYEMTREGGGDPENILDLFVKVVELTQGSSMSEGENAYFYESCKALLRSAIYICSEGYGKISLVDIYNIVSSAPTSMDEVNSDKWKAESECYKALEACNIKEKDRQKSLGEKYQANPELDICARYFLSSYPRFGDRLRSSISSIFTAGADPWLRGKLRKLFCRKIDEINVKTGKTGFYLDPDFSKEGAIYLFDYPIKSGLTGRLSQSLYKLVWQQHFERRDLTSDGGRPCFLFVDEAQLFLTDQDQTVIQTARSNRILTVLLSQNLSNYYDTLGGASSERGVHLTNSLLGNLATTIFHANGEETNSYGSKLFGQEWRYSASTSSSSSSGFSNNHGDQGGSSSSDNTSDGITVNEAQRNVIEARDFTLLRTGGEANNYKVDALIHQTGRIWNATGSNYLKVQFDQQKLGI